MGESSFNDLNDTKKKEKIKAEELWQINSHSPVDAPVREREREEAIRKKICKLSNV